VGLSLGSLSLKTGANVPPNCGATETTERKQGIMGRLYVAILGLLVVGIVVVIQIAQGDSNTLHWVAVGAVVVGLAALVGEVMKARKE
jgi:hypothetical protein